MTEAQPGPDTPTIEIEEFRFEADPDNGTGSDGTAHFMVRWEDDGEQRDHPFHVHFARGGGTTRWKSPIWDWDGNRDAPTLAPSLLAQGVGPGLLAHFYVRRGRIELCPDAEVSLCAPRTG